jgi:hypothetical protein
VNGGMKKEYSVVLLDAPEIISIHYSTLANLNLPKPSLLKIVKISYI